MPIKLDAKNARKHSDRNKAAIEQSLKAVGAGRSILLDGDDNVLAGNGVYEKAQELGMSVRVVETDANTIIAVKRPDLTGDKARQAATLDNIVADTSAHEYDAERLREALQNDDVSRKIAEQDEKLRKLLGNTGKQETADASELVDKAQQLQDKWNVQRGDLWQCGKHRILCGDSTNADDVARVMRGERAQMMFTDPPYGVDYTGGHFHSGNVNIKRERPRLDGDKTTALYYEFLPIALPVVDGPCYMWFADREGYQVFKALHDNECEIHALVIWNKTNATYAAMNAQYKQRHEPCIYFKPKGSTLRWVGASDEATVWDIKRDAKNEWHPTQKPIDLALKAIRNHDAEIIIDFFIGSGSTLVACEQTGRIGRGIEIEPKYVAVTLERLSLLGLECKRIESAQ